MSAVGSADALEDGWRDDTAADDTILRSTIGGFADWMVDLGIATGARHLDDAEVGALDAGSEFFLANTAVLRRPVRDAAWPGLVDRLDGFFRGGPGGPWTLFSAWPTPDVRAEGLDLVGHPPLMVRPAGGVLTPDPDGLTVAEVHDATTVADFARALAESYPAPDAGVFADPAVLRTPGTRMWVGYVDGRPVATSATHPAAGCNVVEFISAHPDVRGRGIGAAVTRRATLADPLLPASLVASDLGRPVYARMGFLTITRFTVWSGKRQ